MVNVFEPIIVKFQDETSGPGRGSRGGGGSGVGAAGAGVVGAEISSGGKGGMAGIAAGLTAVVAVVGEVVGLVKNALDGVLKPLMTLVSGILKLISQLLRPIVDVFMMLLMPILQFLKPIIRVANDVMRPFRVLAYGLMRQASQSGNAVESGALNNLAMTTIFAGIGNVLVGVSGELVKMISGIVIDVLSTTWLMTDETAAKLKDNIGGVIDGVTSSIQAMTLEGLMRLSLNIVRGGEKEILEMNQLFDRVVMSATDNVRDKLIGDPDSVVNTIGEAAGYINDSREDFAGDMSNLVNTTTTGLNNVSKSLSDGIRKIIREAEAAAKRRALRDVVDSFDYRNHPVVSGNIDTPGNRNAVDDWKLNGGS